ncbi:MAG: hypothetical protein HC893_06015 [Chloroflexaceae bacterium]|nr:hypothetical protein [Chloroflexaceae bacterium]
MERREFLRGVAAGMLGGTALYLAACGASAPQEPAEAPAGEPEAPAAEEGTGEESAQAPAAQAGEMLNGR